MATPNNSQSTLKEFVRKPEIMANFERILGSRDAESYVQSVLIAVSASDELMKCTNQSIYRAALRAASLGLSCDPALKQAWLVPYNRKQGDSWVKEAQFQPHYKGLYTLAMRTNKYNEIEVIPIGAGYTVEQSVDGGIVIIHEATGKPALAIPKVKPSDAKIWFAWFRTTRGFVKKVWMTVEEIHEHAKQFNPKGYEGKGSPWQKPEMRPSMEMKTVLRNLLSWADLSGTENAKLAEALRADEPIDVQAEDVPTQTQIKQDIHEMTIEEARDTIIKTPIGEVMLSFLLQDRLNEIYLSDITDRDRRAVALVLKTDFNVNPPEQPKHTEAQIKGQLGF